MRIYCKWSKCDYNQLCNKNSRCKENNENNVCVALSNKNELCDSSDDCAFGLLCNSAVTPHMCTEMFSLEDGKESDEDFLCASGRQYDGKCATTKMVNSNCTRTDDYQTNCQISLNEGGSERTVSQSCKYIDVGDREGKMVCPLQSDSPEMKDYIATYKKEREKMDQKDIEKIHIGLMGENGRFTLNGHKKVLEAYVNLNYYKMIGDNDCIRDYFISEQGANKNKLTILIMLLLSLLVI